MAVQKDDPKTWAKYKKNLCTSCRATCCTLPLEVSIPDLIRLEVLTEEEAVFDLKRSLQKLKKKGVLERVSLERYEFVVSRKANGDCIYLDSEKRSCTQYSKRPEVCRGFPTRVGSRPGYCPYLMKRAV